MLLLSSPPTDKDTELNGRISGGVAVVLRIALRLGDVAAVAGGALMAWWLDRGALAAPPLDYVRAAVHGMLLALLVLSTSSLYHNWRRRSLASELVMLSTQWSVLFVVIALSALAMQMTTDVDARWMLLWFAASLGGAVALRLVARPVAGWVYGRGMDMRNAVVIGASADSQRIVNAISGNPWSGIVMRGWFATHADRGELGGIPRLGDLDALASYIESQSIDQVWIALPMHEQQAIASTLEQLRYSTADIKFVPDLGGLNLLNESVEEVAGLPVINLQQSPLQGPARLVKLIEDRLLAALILLAIAPLMLVIAIAVKLSSPGPVFYAQERVSWNNKRFRMLKFRSLPVDAETTSGAVWARAGDNRATRVGAFLRRTSLDELPQFINVLRGEMSIVGPRPERPVFVDQFKHDIPSYMKKHMVKAGITGWAQINGWRGSTDLAKRIECDIYYLEHWSPWFDLKIIFLTLFKGFVHKNAY